MASIAAEIPIVPGDIWFDRYDRYAVITKLYGTTVETRSLKQPIAELKAKPNSDDISQPSRQFRLNWTFHKRGIRVGDRVSNSKAYRNGDTNNVVTGVVTELFFKNQTLVIRVGEDGNELSAYMFRVLKDEEGLGLTLNLTSMFRWKNGLIKGSIWGKRARGEWARVVVLDTKPLRYRKILTDEGFFVGPVLTDEDEFKKYKMKRRGPRVGERWEDASDDYSVRILNTWTIGDEEEDIDIQYIADDSSFSQFLTYSKFIKTFTPAGPSETDIYKKGNKEYYVANIERGEGKRTYTLRKTNGRDPVEIMHDITSLDSPMLDNKFEFVQNGPRGVWYDEDAGDAIEIELSDYNKDDDGSQNTPVYIKKRKPKGKGWRPVPRSMGMTVKWLLDNFMQPTELDIRELQGDDINMTSYWALKSGVDQDGVTVDDIIYQNADNSALRWRGSLLHATTYKHDNHYITNIAFSPNGKTCMVHMATDETNYIYLYKDVKKSEWGRASPDMEVEMESTYTVHTAITDDTVYYTDPLNDFIATLDDDGEEYTVMAYNYKTKITKPIWTYENEIELMAAVRARGVDFIATLDDEAHLHLHKNPSLGQPEEILKLNTELGTRLRALDITLFNEVVYLMIVYTENDKDFITVVTEKNKLVFKEEMKGGPRVLLRIHAVIKYDHLVFKDVEDNNDIISVRNFITGASYTICPGHKVTNLVFDGDKIGQATSGKIVLWDLPKDRDELKDIMDALKNKDRNFLERIKNLKQKIRGGIPLWTFFVKDFRDLIPELPQQDLQDVLEGDYGKEVFEFALGKKTVYHIFSDKAIKRAIEFGLTGRVLKQFPDANANVQMVAIRQEKWTVFNFITETEAHLVEAVFRKFEGQVLLFAPNRDLDKKPLLPILQKFLKLKLDEETKITIATNYVQHLNWFTKYGGHDIEKSNPELNKKLNEMVKQHATGKIVQELLGISGPTFTSIKARSILDTIDFDKVDFSRSFKRDAEDKYMLIPWVFYHYTIKEEMEWEYAVEMADKLLKKIDINGKPSLLYSEVKFVLNDYTTTEYLIALVKYFDEKGYKHFNYKQEVPDYMINTRNSDATRNDTILIQAIVDGDIDLVRTILDVESVEPNIGHPLFIVGDNDVLKVLLDDPRINREDQVVHGYAHAQRLSILELAVLGSGSVERVKLLMKYPFSEETVRRAIKLCKDPHILILLSPDAKKQQLEQLKQWDMDRIKEQIKELGTCKGYTKEIEDKKKKLGCYEPAYRLKEEKVKELKRLIADGKEALKGLEEELENERDAQKRQEIQQKNVDLSIQLFKFMNELESITGEMEVLDKTYNIVDLRTSINWLEGRCKNFTKRIKALKKRQNDDRSYSVMHNCVNDLDSLMNREWKAQDYQNTIFLDALMKNGKRMVFCLVGKTFEAEMEEMTVECNKLKNSLFQLKMMVNQKRTQLNIENPFKSREVKERELKEVEDKLASTEKAIEECLKNETLNNGIQHKLQLRQYFFPGIYTNWVKTDRMTGDPTDEPMPVSTSGLGGQRGKERYILIDTNSGVRFYVRSEQLEDIVEVNWNNETVEMQGMMLPIVINLKFEKTVALGKMGSSSGTVSGTHGNTQGDVYVVEYIHRFEPEPERRQFFDKDGQIIKLRNRVRIMSPGNIRTGVVTEIDSSGIYIQIGGVMVYYDREDLKNIKIEVVSNLRTTMLQGSSSRVYQLKF